MQTFNKNIRNVRRKLKLIQKRAIEKGLNPASIRYSYYGSNIKEKSLIVVNHMNTVLLFIGVAFVLAALTSYVVEYSLSSRCLLPINHLVWEATRPLSDCNYCANVTKPFILRNITRQNFRQYAYSSKPIIVKSAINHWKATRDFNFYMFKRLYKETIGAYESFEEGCQFLNFGSNLFTLKEVFDMPDARVRNDPGQEPWANCHPSILANMREYYDIPKFLPEDAEFPAAENIFLGYEIGAVMHLDYIPRLMWQGQVKGSKIWTILPVPECEHVCTTFQYYVESGDIVLLDTRLWYHATKIPKGQLSLTVQSEYG